MSKDAAVIQQVDNEQAVIDQLITMELCHYVAQELGYEGLASVGKVKDYFNRLCFGNEVNAEQMLKYVSDLLEQKKVKK